MGLFLAMVASGLAAGLNKGFITQKRAKISKPASRKGKLGRRVKFVREVVREVAGYAPYEKRVMELLKVGKDKRALRVCKNRLGTHQRAKRARENCVQALRAIQAAAKAAGESDDKKKKGKE